MQFPPISARSPAKIYDVAGAKIGFSIAFASVPVALSPVALVFALRQIDTTPVSPRPRFARLGAI